jgi:hypothetical protein
LWAELKVCLSAKGSEVELIFYDAKSFPEAYQLKRLYTISRKETNLKFNIFLGKEEMYFCENLGGNNDLF